MDGALRLLSITRKWPWGLVVISDTKSASELPARLEDNGVAATIGAVAVGIQHEVDGEARAEVWLGTQVNDLRCIYDADFVTIDGSVSLRVADDHWRASTEIGAGVHQLRVLVDEIGSPGLVVYEFSGRRAGTS